jgi:hypothetical protein
MVDQRVTSAFPTASPKSKHCYFCGAPSGDHQICDSPECHDKAGAILRADLDYHAEMWAGRAPNLTGHECTEPHSWGVVEIATFASFALIVGIIILTLPFIVFPLTRGMQ